MKQFGPTGASMVRLSSESLHPVGTILMAGPMTKLMEQIRYQIKKNANESIYRKVVYSQ